MRPAPLYNREVDPNQATAPPLGEAAQARRRGRELVVEGDAMFSARASLLSLWQDVAENFYVERADFTAGRNPGAEFASHLMTGQPLLVRQELANAIAGMLRPTGRDWFKLALRAGAGQAPTQAAAEWLDRAGRTMRAAMYDPVAGFQRAAKQADNDYVAFGNAVLSVDANWRDTALLFRCWHLRDVAWREDVAGRIDEVHRRWKVSAHELMRLFPGGFAPELAHLRPEDRRAREVECRHIVLPADRFGDPAIRHPYVSVYVDVEHGHVMEAVGRGALGYVIPRWQLVSGSVYGYSPPTVASIADARMLQDMTRTIIEAGEKAVDPPMVATQEALRSDLALFPGGVTYVDAAYDERLGQALRPIAQDRSALPLGLDMQRDLRQQIASAWMLNKLTLPTAGGAMTAYEVGQRVQEYIRQAIPLFEPIEAEYNGALCAETFRALLDVGAFGRPETWPPELLGQEVAFRFENPFTAAQNDQALSQYQTVATLLQQQSTLDSDAVADMEPRRMFRDAVKATGAPASWLKDEAVVAAERQALAEQARLAAGLRQLQEGGAAAKAVGEGVAALTGAVGSAAQIEDAPLATEDEAPVADDEAAG